MIATRRGAVEGLLRAPEPDFGCCVGAASVGAIEGKTGAAMPGQALPSLLLVSADCATHLREKERPVWSGFRPPPETWVLPGTRAAVPAAVAALGQGNTTCAAISRGCPRTHCLISTQDTTGRDDDLEEAQPGVVAEE